ncbi:MAG: hypothetical protein E6J00_05120 [Chloroflexi bacterium]|nr:MAG: hypothetical protein E6J00_05120 [Chloroflexota bacterium]
MGKDYRVVTNIKRAQVDEGAGWLEVELEGRSEDVEAALAYCASRGIDVERVTAP